MLLALMGNQNCGKTTVFNQLTGSNQHVGNFPGVTVDKKEGKIRGRKDATVVDLPGIYSLSPYTPEEVVSRNFLLQEHPDGIINVVDATTIERNLYLTLQLLELDMPMVIALNMMDEVKENGDSIDVKALESALGVPVVPIAASKNQGMDELAQRVLAMGRTKQRPTRHHVCGGPMQQALDEAAAVVAGNVRGTAYSPMFAAVKLIERDPLARDALGVTPEQQERIEVIAQRMERVMDTDRDAALADMRYTYIEALCGKAVRRAGQSKAQHRSEVLDRILTHRVLSLPIFFGIMFLIFYITFGSLGAWLGEVFAGGIGVLMELTNGWLTGIGVAEWLRSLIVDGVMQGVGSVFSFLPTILLLFFFLSLLEDSGYMARVAFVMDRLLHRLGLSGRSIVPMLIGFGCSVPALMATRTLPSERDRKMTIRLIPFMSCSAKLPIYAMFTQAFFPQHRAVVMIVLYVLGIVLAVLAALVLKRTAFKGEPATFVMELPAYRIPTPRNMFLHMWDKAWDFIQRAFTIIFVASVVIWVLQTFSWSFTMVDQASHSILASIGSLLAPLFVPLGFGQWQASTALLAGLSAKEAVVSTFSILMGTSSDAALAAGLQTLFTPLQAFSFLAFTLLYMPCVAALAAARRELGSGWAAAKVMLAQTGVAWCVALVIYQGGRLLGWG